MCIDEYNASLCETQEDRERRPNVCHAISTVKSHEDRNLVKQLPAVGTTGAALKPSDVGSKLSHEGPQCGHENVRSIDAH